MDRLFTEGPSGRRRFLDRLTVALEPAHAREIASFEAASVNRRRRLEMGNGDPAYLAIIEDSMARHAVAASAARLDLIDRLNLALGEGVTAPFPAARLELLCLIADRLRSHPALEVEDWLRDRYAAEREADAAIPSPQRMDLLIADPATGLVATEASTGQQKIMLIGIVLAHAALIATWRGAAPVLLLDEPFTHLDAAHRTVLKAALRDGTAQAFLTATDADLFAGLGPDSALWQVRDSRLARET
jgi:DNA replication and repair protein RecF